jgi:hypothetical protein
MTSLLISAPPTETERPLLPWTVLHARPRQEKRLAADLAAAGIEAELITVRRERVYGHRRRIVDLPLFPSFLFARVGDEEREIVLGTGRLVDIIRVRDQARLEEDLNQIRRALAAGAVPEPSPYIRTGVRARVRRGPLEGVVGVADRRLAPNRLILGVDVLGRAVCVQIPDDLLEPLHSAADRRAA